MAAGRPVRISPSDIGQRVSVRRRLAPEETGSPGGPTTTDIVGHLRSWHDGILAIERRDGSLTRVAEAHLIAGRVIPPAPPRRRPRQ